ncbi:hypothetical protein BDR03DRAFT_701103 [Suillus americanus]|nr:hypothetical protein BDR03DRAFT_701103 [Suillus americanus]
MTTISRTHLFTDDVHLSPAVRPRRPRNHPIAHHLPNPCNAHRHQPSAHPLLQAHHMSLLPFHPHHRLLQSPRCRCNHILPHVISSKTCCEIY